MKTGKKNMEESRKFEMSEELFSEVEEGDYWANPLFDMEDELNNRPEYIKIVFKFLDEYFEYLKESKNVK